MKWSTYPCDGRQEKDNRGEISQPEEAIQEEREWLETNWKLKRNCQKAEGRMKCLDSILIITVKGSLTDPSDPISSLLLQPD